MVGTKNVNKELLKISQGTKKDKSIKWFPELSDKRKSYVTFMQVSMCCASNREKHQNSLVLGYEKLWCFSRYSSAAHC